MSYLFISASNFKEICSPSTTNMNIYTIKLSICFKCFLVQNKCSALQKIAPKYTTYILTKYMGHTSTNLAVHNTNITFTALSRLH